jgi:exopolysaccharide biosynthesis polyprenyl glycosylphosphotransferase
VPRPGTSLSEARGLGITKVGTDERLGDDVAGGAGSAVNFAAESDAQRPAAPRRLRRPLSNGIGRPLLVLDCAAFGVTVLVAGERRPVLLAMLALTLGLYAGAGLYRSRLTLSALDDLPSLMSRAMVAGAVITALASVIGTVMGTTALITSALFGVLALGGRAVAYAMIRRARSSGFVRHDVLILGAGEVGGLLAQTLLDHPDYGLVPVGFLDNDPLLRPEQQPVPVLGQLADLAATIQTRRIRVVVVAFGSMRESGVVEILRTCDRLRCEIFFVPRLYELCAMSREMDLVWGIPLVRLRRAAFRTFGWRAKRAMDALLASVALVVAAPLIAACAAAIRLQGFPGVLFRQERVGLDGRSFTVLKLRTLRPVNTDESAVRWNVADDTRLTRVGRFLRRTSLDELPQLWNVVRGDMSLVGPRPERPFFVTQFTQQLPRYTSRHRVPAGITGWAQIHGLRGDTSIADRARFDNYAIENWSLWQDVKILLRTLGQVVRGAGG